MWTIHKVHFVIRVFALARPKWSTLCDATILQMKKNLRKFDSAERATFEGNLGVLVSDTSWDQACLSTKPV